MSGQSVSELTARGGARVCVEGCCCAVPFCSVWWWIVPLSRDFVYHEQVFSRQYTQEQLKYVVDGTPRLDVSANVWFDAIVGIH